MVLEVGSGHEKVSKYKGWKIDGLSGSASQLTRLTRSCRQQFHKLSTALSAELRRAFRAKSYYEEARFHASTACLTIPAESSSTETDGALGPRFGKIVADTEAKWGAQLRKSPPTWATRIGIQVANRIAYVDI